MNNRAYWDTCLAIAFVFHINSLHNLSNKVFSSYNENYWSNYVKKEYEYRYEEKFKHLSKFLRDLNRELETPEQEFFSLEDLTAFVLKNYSGKLQKDAKSSIKPFWGEYIGIQSQIPFNDLKNDVVNCLNDLSINTEINGDILEKDMHLTPQRTADYRNIDLMLKSEGVADKDRHVVLDGHDFAKYSADPVDFITFDETVYYGAKNVKILSFDSIKGKYDFDAS